MARGKRRPKGGQAFGHSATENGWFVAPPVTVEKVEDKAREMWGLIEDPPAAARAVGRVEGMAIALAILKGPGGRASHELKRIKGKKVGHE